MILDGSTDSSANHVLSVSFQTLENNNSVVHFYKLINMGFSATAKDHVDAIGKAFTEDLLMDDMKELLVGWTR